MYKKNIFLLFCIFSVLFLGDIIQYSSCFSVDLLSDNIIQQKKIHRALDIKSAAKTENNNHVITVENVSIMRGENLIEGRYISTLGYYSVNDGGSASYFIRKKNSTDTDDGGSVIFLDNGYVAELINNNLFINVCQFGITNGKYINDQWKSVVNAFSKSKKPIFFPGGTYYIKKSINQSYGIKTPLIPMYGENATIICDGTFDSESDAFYFDETAQQFENYIKGFTFDSASQSKVRYYLNFDGSLKTHYKFQIRNNVFLRHASYAIYTDGNTRTGLFNSCEFSDNIVRGLFFKSDNLGDSNRIERNTLLGDNTRELGDYVINIKQTSGAACLSVTNNNCSSGLGCFVNCQCISFDNNQIENTSQTSLDYILKIINCKGANLTNNNLNAHYLSGLLYITGINASISGILLKYPAINAYALESNSNHLLSLKSVNYSENSNMLNLNYVPGAKVKGAATNVLYRTKEYELIMPNENTLHLKPLVTSQGINFYPFRLMNEDTNYCILTHELDDMNRDIPLFVLNKHTVKIEKSINRFIKLEGSIW